MKGSHLDCLYARAARDAIPLHVSLELTSRCPFRCRHCYLPEHRAPDALTTRRALRLLDELVDMGTLHLTLTGGDPLLRSDWRPIAQRARELGFQLHLFTTGATLTAETADVVAGLHCPVEITLHSLRADGFDRVTGITGSLARTLRGVELLHERGVDVCLKSTILDETAGDVAEVREYADRLGLRFRADAALLPRRNGDLSPLSQRVDERRLLPDHPGIRPLAGGHAPTPPDDDLPLCAAANRTAHVAASGHVMACAVLPGSAGSLVESGFREIWETSPWLRRVRSIRRRDLRRCDSCTRLGYCGRCHALALLEDGDLQGPSSWAGRHAQVVESARGWI